MADKELSSITAASALDGTETVHVVQGGNSRKATVEQFGSVVETYDLSATGNTLDSGNEIDIDVSGFTEIKILINNVNFGSTEVVVARVSTDGGSTFLSGASDYSRKKFGNADSSSSFLLIADIGTDMYSIASVSNLNNSGSKVMSIVSSSPDATEACIVDGTTSAVDAIRLYSLNGNAATSGEMTVIKRR